MRDRIAFLLSETWASLRRNTMLQIAAVSTACIALVLLGAVGMALYKLDATAHTLPSQFEVEIFLKVSVPRAQSLEMKKMLEAMPEVARVKLVPREQGWEELKKNLKDDVNLADLPNPLPDKLIVAAHQPEQLPLIAERVRKDPRVDEVLDHRNTLEEVLSVARLVRWVGIGAGGLLLFSALVLIYNAVRLTIYSRQREVGVMALVGATLTTIRAPFVLEGMIQGGLGGLVAAGLVLAGAGVLSDMMVRLWPFLKDLPPGLPPVFVLVGLPLLGSLLGGLCAWWAARRFVRIWGEV
ncbi:MAG: ABC transporter permease [Fimbriimonadales bacterium]|jgi:cell division transport system permease protein|nr:ABC transporter permease [Armatimonadota bacterium]MCX7687745.1 ABC transporter permease [Fimbriimonadales bacterium]CUU10229.1 cell division transport system permease protein [Armatimonadetes bacterium GBS]CUU35807.1 cell division transport system permease protein [Armatimonadetes bacterium DC]CUU36761.1 cell division transport system permease protein [Armatimonadetes bacterium GXS]GBC91081.1 Cell division protein FtsX [bacterium HR14]